jgi:hypothetical protein
MRIEFDHGEVRKPGSFKAQRLASAACTDFDRRERHGADRTGRFGGANKKFQFRHTAPQ